MRTLIVMTTCPDADCAEAIARSLVEQGLVACAHVQPGVRSIYRWQGRIACDNEVRLTLKTTEARFPAVRDAIVARHPYELPELIAVEAVAGLDRYLDWVGESTLPPADS